MKGLTVSIVTYKTDLKELESCLQSLQSPIVQKIYVIDNSEQKYISDYCSTKQNVVYIGSENVGYGAGHNKAIRLALEADIDYHLVLNSDVSFNPEVLSILIDYMNVNPEVGQVQPKIIYPNGELQYTVRMLPTPKDLIFRRFLPKRIVEHSDYKYLLKFADHDKEMNVPYHQGSFMLFRVESLRSVGLFDERFFMYPEDIDITRRMYRLYRTMYFPEVSVIHNHRAASYKSSRMLRIHIINMIRYFNKWGWIFDSERRKYNRLLMRYQINDNSEKRN